MSARIFGHLAIMALSGLFASGSAWAELQYSVRDLGTFGASTDVSALNDNGSVLARGNGQSYLLNGASVSQIGNGFQGEYLNNNGWVTGTAAGIPSLFNGSRLIDARTLIPNLTHVGGINNLNEFSGTVTPVLGGETSLLVYGRSGVRDLGLMRLGPPVDYSVWEGLPGPINDAGIVTGQYDWARSGDWRSGVRTIVYDGTTLKDLHQFTPRYLDPTQPMDINSKGQIALVSQDTREPQIPRAVLYDGTTMRDIGPPSHSAPGQFPDTYSGANGMNDAGWVVGYSALAFYGTPGVHPYAFVYDGSTMLDLNQHLDTSGSTWDYLQTAEDINNKGQITGVGLIGGVRHIFLATPVPEPETYALMAAGLLVVGLASRRRRSRAR